MADKRRRARVRGRYRVDFESGGRRGTGVTANLSETGMHLSSAVVFLPGTRLGGVVRLPTGDDASFQAEVRWAKKLRGPDALAMQNSMGLEFTAAAPEEYLEFLRARLTPAPPFPDGTDPSWGGVALVPRTAGSSVAPPPTVSHERADTPRPGRLRLGLEGLSSLTLGQADLVGPERPHECVFALGRAATLIEDAAARAVDGFLPEEHRLVPMQIEITLGAAVTLPHGTTLAAACRLTSLGEDGRTLIFEASISAMRQELARARVACLLVPW